MLRFPGFARRSLFTVPSAGHCPKLTVACASGPEGASRWRPCDDSCKASSVDCCAAVSVLGATANAATPPAAATFNRFLLLVFIVDPLFGRQPILGRREDG